MNTAEPIEWWADANCATTDPDLFVLDKGGSTMQAKRICGECPVRAACLQYALDQDIRTGIYGGMSPTQRRALRRAAA